MSRGTLVWLLDLSIGANVFRYSSFPVTFDGKQYEGGLDEIEIIQDLGIAGSTPSAREVTIDIIPTNDMSRIYSFNNDFAALRGTLTLWDSAKPEFMSEVQILDGRVVTPEIGAFDELISFTLSADPFDDNSVLQEGIVNSKTHGDVYPESSEGARYPWVVGKPGFLEGTVRDPNTYHATPGIVIETWGDTGAIGTGSYVFPIISAGTNDANGDGGNDYRLLCPELAEIMRNSFYNSGSGLEVTFYDEGNDWTWGSDSGNTEGLVGEQSYYASVFAYTASDAYVDQIQLFDSRGKAVSRLSSLAVSFDTLNPVTTSLGLKIANPLMKKLLISEGIVDQATVDVYADQFDRNRRAYRMKDWPILTGTDGENRKYSYVTSETTGAVDRTEAKNLPLIEMLELEDFSLGWDHHARYASFKSGSLETVGEVLRELAFKSSVPVDQASWNVVEEKIPWRADFYIQDDSSPMDVLLDIIKYVPVGVYSNAQGLAGVVIETEVKREECVKLTEGRNAFREGSIEFIREPDELNTAVSIYAGLDRYSDEYTQSSIVSKNLNDVVDSSGGSISKGYTTNAYIIASNAEGDLETEVDLDITWSKGTCQKIAKWYARWTSISPVSIKMLINADLAFSLKPGTTVTYTNSELYFDERIGIIIGRRITDNDLWSCEVLFFADTVDAKQSTSTSMLAPTIPTFNQHGA